MNALSLRTWVRNAAAVFSGCYGAATRQAGQSGCSRQTVHDRARQVEQRLRPAAPARPPVEGLVPAPVAALDEPTRRRVAVTAFAMGISTRQVEDLLRIILPEGGPGRSTIARWVADEARKAKPAPEALDAACVPRVQTLAPDEISLGGGRPRSASNRRA